MTHKKIIALVLCLLMFFSAFANLGCSKDEDLNAPVTAKATNVYKPEFIEIPENINFNSNSLSVSGNMIYAQGSEIISEEPYKVNPVIISVNPENYEISINTIKLPQPDENNPNDWYLNNSCVASDGSVVYVASQYDPETSSQKYALIKTDKDGNEIFNVNPQDIFTLNPEQNWFYVNQICAGKNGIYLAYETKIACVNPDGSKAFEIELGNWAETIIIMPDGKAAVKYRDQQSNQIVFQIINTEQKALGDKIDIPQSFLGGNSEIYFGEGYDLYIKNDNGVYGFNYGDTEPKELLNWINSDISINNIHSMTVLSETKFVCSLIDYATKMPGITVLKRVPDDEIKEKIIITLGCLSRDYSITDYIVDFNMKNDNYRIQLKDYSAYNTSDDRTLGLTTLNNDIAAGNMPDILLTSPQMPVKSYENKGLFADLYEFMDNDAEFEREDLMKCARVPFENDGNLYGIGTSFFLQGLTGKIDNIGEREGWTVSEMLEFAKSLPDNRKLLENTSPLDMIYMMSMFSGFIDYENKTCSFDSPDFIELLEYLKSVSEDGAKTIPNQNEKNDTAYKNDEVMLSMTFIGSLRDYISEKLRFGIENDINMVGFPTPDGKNGMVVSMSNKLSVSAKSPSKEAAWEFIKLMLTQDVQTIFKRTAFEFPTTVKRFNEIVEDELKTYYFFGDDGSVSSSDTPFDENGLSESNYYAGDVTPRKGIAFNFTQEDIDEFNAILDSTTYSIDSVDEKLLNIIKEEADAYFNGAKSAEETADVIQGRISIYLSENS